MSRPELLINGYLLSNDSVGTGAYAGRLIRLLMARRDQLPFVPRVVVPSWMKPDLRVAFDVEGLASPKMKKELLTHAIWSQCFGAHARQCGGMLFSPNAFWSVRAPERSIVCQHDRICRHFPRYLGRRGLRKWLHHRTETFLRRCRFIVTESEHARTDIMEIPGVRADRIRVIRAWLPDEFNPSNAHRDAAGVRQKYGLPERFWLYIGGYDHRKNVELLISAYARVAHGHRAPALVLAGRMPPRDELYCDVEGAMQRARLSDGDVIRPGFIATEDMPGLYGASELMIYPSLYEGFGLPPMEAMGCGCPALCADNSSLPEVVRDASYRFSTSDDMALTHLLSQASTERLPMNPSFKREDFDEHTAGAAYISLFAELSKS